MQSRVVFPLLRGAEGREVTQRFFRIDNSADLENGKLRDPAWILKKKKVRLVVRTLGASLGSRRGKGNARKSLD